MRDTIDYQEYPNKKLSWVWSEELIFSVASENSLSDILNFIEFVKTSDKFDEDQRNQILNIYEKVRRCREEIDSRISWIKELDEQKAEESFKQTKLVENLKESLNSPDIEYRFYWWTWKSYDDLFSHFAELWNLRSWTNVDWVNSSLYNDTLIAQWMDVWFAWDQLNYVISNIDSEDKYSEWYNNCTGIVLLWTDKDWKQISLLSHQNPAHFLSDANFKNDIIKKLWQFSKKCIDWTINAFIVWWNVWTDLKDQTYSRSVWYLSKIIQDELNKKPIILNPNNNSWTVTVKVETWKNKIIILQPNQK